MPWPKNSILYTFRSRIVKTSKKWISIGTPLSRAPAALADHRENTLVWRIEERELLLGEVGPGTRYCSANSMSFWEAPKVLRGVGVGLLVMPVDLDLRIMKLCEGLTGQLAAHEGVESVAKLAGDLDVLLRHRPRSIS
jgi:hypothetical protein